MNSSALKKILESFQGNPVGPVPTSHDWEVIEKAIDRTIPPDYKAIVEHTGGSSMGRCTLRNPAPQDNIYVALSHAALSRVHLLWNEMVTEELQIELYPEPAGWIQLAVVDRNYFMLKPEGDEIVIVSISGWEVIETGVTFSELMWSMFLDRELYDGLGRSIWHHSDQVFGLH
jgi:hypothetical protein